MRHGGALLSADMLLRQFVGLVAVVLHLGPDPLLEVERVHIVAFLCDSLDATKQEQVAVVGSNGVAASRLHQQI